MRSPLVFHSSLLPFYFCLLTSIRPPSRSGFRPLACLRVSRSPIYPPRVLELARPDGRLLFHSAVSACRRSIRPDALVRRTFKDKPRPDAPAAERPWIEDE